MATPPFGSFFNIRDNLQAAVQLDNHCTGFQISGSFFSQCSFGVNLIGTNYAAMMGCTFNAATASGVAWWGSTGLDIAGCSFSNGANNGIFGYLGGYNAITGSTFVSNARSALIFLAPSACTVVGNSAANNAYGMNIQSGSFHVISQNALFNNSVSDITLGCISSTVIGNICYTNTVSEIGSGGGNVIAQNLVQSALNITASSGASAAGNIIAATGQPAQIPQPWIGTLRLNGGAATGYTASVVGWYQINSNVVTAQFKLTISLKGTAPGAVTIAGLPVAASSLTGMGGGGQGAPSYSGFNALSGTLLLDVAAGSTSITLNQAGPAQTGPVTDVNLTGSTTLYGAVSYLI